MYNYNTELWWYLSVNSLELVFGFISPSASGEHYVVRERPICAIDGCLVGASIGRSRNHGYMLP